MATHYTDTAALQNGDPFDGLPDANDLQARVTWAKGSYTTTTSGDEPTAAGTVLRIAQLPKGAIVIPGLSFVDTEALGTGVQIKIGDDDNGGDDDRYAAASSNMSLAAAGLFPFKGGVAGPNPYQLTSTSWIQGTIVNGGSISVTNDKDLTVWIAYILP